MKVYVIGDPHFKNSNINDMDLLTEKIILEAEKIKPNFIVILGDVLDRHSNIHMTPLNRSTKFFDRLRSISKLYILIGNHDRRNNQDFLSEEHPFTAVEKWTNVVIANKPIMEKIDDYYFTFVPFVPPGRFREALDYVPGWEKSKCIFAHQEFYGCKNGTIFSLVGDKWEEDAPLVVSGHIHDYCHLQRNIIYCGTPHQNDYGERLDKTVSLFEFDDQGYLHKRLDLKLPKKIMHEIDVKMVSDYNLSFGDHHKVIIIGTNTELKDINKHPNVIKWKNQGSIVIKKPIINRKEEKSVFSGQYSKKVFIDILRNKIEKDNKVLNFFEKEFGSLVQL